MAIDTETKCQCGASYGGSNRCPDCGRMPNPSLRVCLKEATGASFGERLKAAKAESRRRAEAIAASNREALRDVPDGHGPSPLAEFLADRQELKARVHEAKAGKTFRRTKKHLKKADRHRRRAGR